MTTRRKHSIRGRKVKGRICSTLYRKARRAGWNKKQATKYARYRLIDGRRIKNIDLWR